MSISIKSHEEISDYINHNFYKMGKVSFNGYYNKLGKILHAINSEELPYDTMCSYVRIWVF